MSSIKEFLQSFIGRSPSDPEIEKLWHEEVEPAIQAYDKEQMEEAQRNNELRYKHIGRDTQPNKPHHILPAEHSLTSDGPMRRY